MGKFKFTLSNIFFWGSLLFVSFLTENMLYLTSEPRAGLNLSALIVLTAAAVGSLFMFFFINHRKNKMKIDYVLFPIIAILGIAWIVAIWLAKGGTYTFANGEGTIEVTFTLYEKIRATIILVVFLAFSYGYLFVLNMNSPHSRVSYIMCYAAIIAAYASLIFSLIVERGSYVAIFKGDPEVVISIVSFYGNKNYYGGVLLVGILACMIANYHKQRFYLFLTMNIFLVALISTAAVLPSLIALVAVPVYFFEEVIRFSVKKKWKTSIFATISILMLLALIIVFYIGTIKHWDGFVGLDAYLSQTFYNKDFFTFTGRTKIWENIFPYCFDSIFHAIFGHGFMLTEKETLAITGAMNNSVAAGVRTTHNGYLQVLFEFGLIGFIANMALIVYYLYACIRLCMEKRFHFVFVHFFAFLCMMAFNFGESSPFFDAGIKEMFISMAFVMPVITRYKFINRKEKMEEIKEANVRHRYMDPVELGMSVSIMIVSLIVPLAVLFISEIIQTHDTAFKWCLNGLIFLGIALLFIPYLFTLYYKKTERGHFAINAVFNLGSILLASFAVYWVLRTQNRHDLIIWLVPTVFAGLLLIDTLIYSLAKKGSIIEYLKVFGLGSFVVPKIAIFGSALVGILCQVIFQYIGQNNMFTFIFSIPLTFMVFYALLYFFPSKYGVYGWEYFNELSLYNQKRITILDEKYYG